MFLLVVGLLASFYTAFTAESEWKLVQRGEKAAQRKERRAEDAKIDALIAEIKALDAAEKKYTPNYVGPVTKSIAHDIKPSYFALRNDWVKTVWNPLCRASGRSSGLQKASIKSEYLSKYNHFIATNAEGHVIAFLKCSEKTVSCEETLVINEGPCVKTDYDYETIVRQLLASVIKEYENIATYINIMIMPGDEQAINLFCDQLGFTNKFDHGPRPGFCKDMKADMGTIRAYLCRPTIASVAATRFKK